MEYQEYRICVSLKKEQFLDLVSYANEWGESPSESLARAVETGLNVSKLAYPSSRMTEEKLESIADKLEVVKALADSLEEKIRAASY